MNKYLLEAFDAYPYDLVQTIESLDYALSYDEDCAHTWCLYGRLYAEQFQEYAKAIDYFETALQKDFQSVRVYPYYITTLLSNEDYEKAKKAIDFASGLKGIQKNRILYLKAIYFEYLEDYKQALSTLKESEKYSFNEEFKELLEETEKRIKAKEKPTKPENKGKEKVIKKTKKKK